MKTVAQAVFVAALCSLAFAAVANAAVIEVSIPCSGTSCKAWVALDGSTAAACHWKVGSLRAAKEPTCSSANGWTTTQKRETLAAASTSDPVKSMATVVAANKVAEANAPRFEPAYSQARDAALANRPADPVWVVRKFGTGLRTAAQPVMIQRAEDGIEDAYEYGVATTVQAGIPCICKRVMFPPASATASPRCFVPDQPVAVVAQCVRR